jgi:hypothetical protein
MRYCVSDQALTAPQHVVSVVLPGNRLNIRSCQITQEKITYPYMHVRSKTFPWGDCGLFEHCEEEGEGEE